MSNPRLPSRNYEISWHWRDQSNASLSTDRITATTVQAAISKLVAQLSDEYADVRRQLAVIAAVTAE